MIPHVPFPNYPEIPIRSLQKSDILRAAAAAQTFWALLADRIVSHTSGTQDQFRQSCKVSVSSSLSQQLNSCLHYF